MVRVNCEQREKIEICRTDYHGPSHTRPPTDVVILVALPHVQTVRRSKRRLRIVDNYGDDSDYGLPEEESESEDEKLNVSTGTRDI